MVNLMRQQTSCLAWNYSDSDVCMLAAQNKSAVQLLLPKKQTAHTLLHLCVLCLPEFNNLTIINA